MIQWFGGKKEKTVVLEEQWPLMQAIEQAVQVWRATQNRVSQSETKSEIDDAILYQRLAEKRYAFLLNQARKQWS